MTASICAGRGTPLGGISPERSFCRMISQPSRFAVRDAGLVKASIIIPPEANASLWQGAHVLVRTGVTVVSKVGASAARSKPPAHTPTIRLLSRNPMDRRRYPSDKMLLRPPKNTPDANAVPGVRVAYADEREIQHATGAPSLASLAQGSGGAGLRGRRAPGAQGSGRPSKNSDLDAQQFESHLLNGLEQ